MHPEQTIQIMETTVGTIGNWRVTVANIMKEDLWIGPDGTEHKGATAQVGLYDAEGQEQGEAIIGVGATLTISDSRWKVTRVETGGAGRNGLIELRGPISRLAE